MRMIMKAVMILALAIVPRPAIAIQKGDQAELNAIAEDAYIYAYPLVIMELTRRNSTSLPATPRRSPMGAFAHAPTFPDHNFTGVVRPNADTLYSSLWYDVSASPLVFDVPDSGGRYYMIQYMDMWSDTYASTGPRTTGTSAQRIAVVGPNWTGDLPAGAEILRSPTHFGWVLGRTQTNGVTDYAAVRAFQAGFRVVSPVQPAAWGAERPAGSPPPVVAIERLSPREFFTVFTSLMVANPPHSADSPMAQRMRRLGMVPGRVLAWDRLAPGQRAAIENAHDGARGKLTGGSKNQSCHDCGWTMNIGTANVGSYGVDYVARARIAAIGLGANLREDALYPSSSRDSEGNLYDSAARYVVHFKAAQLPPVRAFWSLSLYDDRQLFAANSINRFALGDRDKLTFNADGSLDLYVQRDAPGDAQMANWLPAPQSGSFSLSLRLYWPKAEALSESWTPPLVKRRP